MLTFLKRLLTLVVFMAAAALLARSLFEFIPGDKARLVLGETASEADIAAWNRAHGYDRPFGARLSGYARGLARGDLGKSDIEGKEQPVVALLRKKLPATMALALAAGLFGSFAGLGLALAAARWPGTRIAAACDLVCSAGLVLPTFVLGPVLIWLFAVVLGWLPSGDLQGWRSFPLPVAALSAGFAAYLGRFGRTLLAVELEKDYTRAARARGLSQTAALVKHALPNAAVPLLTAISLQVAALLGGAILTEVIFRWPGIGELTVKAVQRHDLDLVGGIVMWGVLIYMLVVAIADFLILALDPVAREQG